MTMFKWIRNYVKQYSFITRTEFKGAIFYIYYNKNNKECVKKLPYRAGKTMLRNRIESIKNEIGYYETKLLKSKTIIEELKNEKRETIPFGHS